MRSRAQDKPSLTNILGMYGVLPLYIQLVALHIVQITRLSLDSIRLGTERNVTGKDHIYIIPSSAS